MRNNVKKAAIAGAAVAVIAVGGGIAQASATRQAPANPTPAAAVTVADTDTDTDTVQQGDQTAPDTTGKVAALRGAQAAGPGDQRDAAADEPAGEPGTETEGANEKAGDSDGPGGHQDPPGDVQHEGGADEK